MSFVRDCVITQGHDGYYFDIDGITKGVLGPFATVADLAAEFRRYPNPGSYILLCDDTDAFHREWGEAMGGGN